MSESEIKIIDYRTAYARNFRELNYEWLQEFFEVEPYDRIVLNDPQKHIIEHGGVIFFARVGKEIVGTCALLKHTDHKYELAKMGVTKEYRGHGIGRRLSRAAIDKARSLGAKTLVLATSTRLATANHLYESLGFRHARLSDIGPLPYKRESIVMAMDL
jgi:putative acetyltransferase